MRIIVICLDFPERDGKRGGKRGRNRVVAFNENEYRVSGIRRYSFESEEGISEVEAANDFLNKAFSSDEQKTILTTTVDNSSSQGYSKWSTSGGNNTQDKIFLLSFAEASRYLGVLCDNRINLNAQAWPTAYALKKGAYTVSGNMPAVWWWLRSPGYGGYNAATVNNAGSLGNLNVSYDHSCVRPAFWLDLDADAF